MGCLRPKAVALSHSNHIFFSDTKTQLIWSVTDACVSSTFDLLFISSPMLTGESSHAARLCRPALTQLKRRAMARFGVLTIPFALRSCLSAKTDGEHDLLILIWASYQQHYTFTTVSCADCVIDMEEYKHQVISSNFSLSLYFSVIFIHADYFQSSISVCCLYNHPDF